ncbi:MAG: molybdopterin oxidoreductase family protein [Deltaproteobacteria bacterium]|nr:molybdopterin oxidoreductase family protein [Deltaproteobacteria bacterium]
MSLKHYQTCPLCEATCGVVIEHDGREVLGIRGDDDDPFSRGYICPKAAALVDIHQDPDRLRQPVRRVGDRWEPMGWDEALDHCAERLADVQRRHGRDAVALYRGNPIAHGYAALLYSEALATALGTRSRYSATSVDQLPHMLASLHVFGHQALFAVPDLERTAHLVIIGGNPLVSNGSLMTAPDMRSRLAAIRARGGRVVVIDPRRTETAKVADEHHFVRPGADAALLAAMVHTLFDEKLDRPARLTSMMDGVESIRAAVARFTPERVAGAVGLEATTIRRIAREIAQAPSAAVYGRVGISVAEFGGLSCWLLLAMNALTGNLDRAGGLMFPTPPIDFLALLDRLDLRGSHGRRKSRVRGLPEFGGELPVSSLAEDMEVPGPGRIRAFVSLLGNPVLSTPNGRRLDRALAGLDFVVAVDLYVNETTRHADVILPGTFALERDHYDAALHLVATRNTAKWSPPLFEKKDDQRHDWQIMLELALRTSERAGLRRGLLSRLAGPAARRIRPDQLVDLLLRLGPYELSLAKLREHPHGLDLGPLVPRLPDVLRTRDRRVHLAPAPLVADLDRLAAGLDREPADGELLLIGRRSLRSNNSWMHNSHRLVKGPARCTLLMHPEDARQRGLAEGDVVAVASRVGEVQVPLTVTDDVMKGVVSLPHGWGHGRPGVQLSVASAHPGASINDLTDDAFIDTYAGTSVLNGTPVQVKQRVHTDAGE